MARWIGGFGPDQLMRQGKAEAGFAAGQVKVVAYRHGALRMRIITWNLNHRAARRRIPEWVAPTLGAFAPDTAVLTEYVLGADHDRFMAQLAEAGLGHAAWTPPTSGHNQVLIASRQPLASGRILAPSLHPAVPSNFLHVALPEGIDVFGFRMPAFSGSEAVLKRTVWAWLLQTLTTAGIGRAILTGDFNTAVTDGANRGGDQMRQMLDAGWTHALPGTGASWRKGEIRRVIDHVLVHGRIGVERAEFSWQFQDEHPDAKAGTVGLPDHAILLTDLVL